MRVLSLFIILASWSTGFSDERIIPPMSLEELVNYWGYAFETHHVVTEDGYILGVHRIPGKLDEPVSNVQKPVVLLGHAMLISSSQWVFGPPEKSLGYVLADMGYDVWMTNLRGNTFSRNHTHFDTCSSCPDFWSYSFDEGGSKDYPAVVDHILAQTKVEYMYFFGHSMGTTQFTIFLSTHPEYNAYFKAGFLMAPAVFMGNSQDAIFQISQWADDVEGLFHLLGIYEFLPHSEVLAELGHLFCHVEEHPDFNEICANIGFLLLGYNLDQLNKTMLPTYLDHYPAGMATRPVVHFAQLHMAKDQFIRFDFGSPEENLAIYGQETPPAYDLSKVSTKIAIYIGDNDDTSTYADGEVLASALPNAIRLETVGLVGCTHMDFALGVDAREKIYDPIIQLMLEIEAGDVKN